MRYLSSDLNSLWFNVCLKYRAQGKPLPPPHIRLLYRSFAYILWRLAR